MTGALEGITVLDLSQQLPGPYATMLLRELGARVVKVEPPGGDVARRIDPPMFDALNAGKESIELDLKTDEHRALAARLCRRCDVLVEGFRPGVADRLGVGYAAMSAARPGLVYCSLSGYGQRGPYGRWAGHDVNYLGVGGGAEAAGGVPARRIGLPVVDLASGTTAALAIVAALRKRDADGRGCHLDVAMLDAAVVWSNLKPLTPGHGPDPAYGVFRTGDGRALSIAALEDKFWVALCDVLGWSDWAADPALADYAGRRDAAGAIADRLARALLGRPRDEWLELFVAADVPVAPAHEGDAVRDDPQVRARGLFRDAPARLRSPLPLSLTAVAPGGVPGLGEHGDALRVEVPA